MKQKIYIFSIFNWKSNLLHREHMLALAFSRLGYEVCFVERSNKKIVGFRTRQEGKIEILTVFGLPYMRGVSRQIFKMNDAIINKQLARELKKEKNAWLILSSPLWTRIVLKEKMTDQILVYDMSDNHLAFATNELWRKNLKEYEDELLQTADYVFVSSDSLLEKVPSTTKRAVFGNGVDLDNFANAKPVLKKKYKGKIVGFIGGIYHRIDLSIVKDCALKYPEANFVLIGPTDQASTLKSLSKIKNIHYLGPKPWPEIQDYFASLDVGIIPFVPESVYPWLKTVDSVKIYQYAYFGYPMVVTHFGNIENLAGLVKVAPNKKEFLNLLGEALTEKVDPTKTNQRKALAEDHDWLKIATLMTEDINKIKT